MAADIDYSEPGQPAQVTTKALQSRIDKLEAKLTQLQTDNDQLRESVFALVQSLGSMVIDPSTRIYEVYCLQGHLRDLKGSDWESQADTGFITTLNQYD